MGMPIDLVLVRHGQSEINEITHAEKMGVEHEYNDEVYGRHDHYQRLTPLGVEQALTARKWMLDNGVAPEDFDERYVSTLFRTIETAQHLGGAALWLPETNIVERSWGVFGSTPRKEREKRFAETMRAQDASSFFARYDGGESIHDAVLRVREWIDTLDRDTTDMRVLAVTHGELMWCIRFAIERMMPHEWQDLDNDKSLRIMNCNMLMYTRQNPEDPEEIRTSLSSGWRRMIDPTDPSRSPYGGEWVELQGKRRIGREQMLGIIATAPRIIPDIRELST